MIKTMMHIKHIFTLIIFVCVLFFLSFNLSAEDEPISDNSTKSNSVDAPLSTKGKEAESEVEEISVTDEKNRIFRKDVILITNEILEKVQKNYPNLAEKLDAGDKENIFKSIVKTLGNGLKYCPAGNSISAVKNHKSTETSYPAIIIASQRVLYARVDNFTEKILDQLAQDFANSFRLANPPSGLILDLRSAKGNQIEQALKGLGLFVKKEKIPLPEKGIKPFQRCVKTPVLILIGEKTAGAAELFTMLLTKTGKAMPIGEKTAGEPFVKNKINLSNGDFLMIPEVPTYLSHIAPNAVVPAIKTNSYPQIDYQKLRSEVGSEAEDQALQRAIELIICLKALTPDSNLK